MIYLDWPGQTYSPSILLLHFDGDFADYSPDLRTVTEHGTVVTTATNAKFGQCFTKDGADWLTVEDADSAFDFQDQIFSVDFWIYVDSTAVLNTDNIIIGKWTTGDGRWFISLNGTNERIQLGRRSSSVYLFENLTSGPLARNTMYHVAVWRYAVGGQVQCALNGVIDGTVAANSFDSGTMGVGIFAVYDGGAPFSNGIYVDEIRVCRDVIDYGTADFTPPASPY